MNGLIFIIFSFVIILDFGSFETFMGRWERNLHVANIKEEGGAG